jgi:hypothetical protein
MSTAGSIAYVIDDEDYAPHGRSLDVRVHYSWLDYDPADEPHAEWGPAIETVEVVAVRYFDAEGNEIAGPSQAAAELTEMAWDLVQAESERVLEACRVDGYRTAAGEAPPWYYPAKQVARIVPRLSPSISTRSNSTSNAAERRQIG